MKYRLIGKGTIGPDNPFQVQATQTIGKIKEGTLGGYVCSPNNLSQSGTAWIGEGVRITDPRVRVTENARIFVKDDIRVDGLIIKGHVHIYGKTTIEANGKIEGFENPTASVGELPHHLEISDAKIKSKDLRIIASGEIRGVDAKVDRLDIVGSDIRIDGYLVTLKGETLMVKDSANITDLAYIDATWGLIQDKATISEHVRIVGSFNVKDKALIRGNAKLYVDDMTISGESVIEGEAVIRGNPFIMGSVTITDKARLHGSPFISDNVRIEGNTIIKGDAIICDNAILSKKAKVIGAAFIRYDLNTTYNRSKEIAMLASTGLLPDERGNYRMFAYAVKQGDKYKVHNSTNKLYSLGNTVQSTFIEGGLLAAPFAGLRALEFKDTLKPFDEKDLVLLEVEFNKKDILSILEAVQVRKFKLLREVEF